MATRYCRSLVRPPHRLLALCLSLAVAPACEDESDADESTTSAEQHSAISSPDNEDAADTSEALPVGSPISTHVRVELLEAGAPPLQPLKLKLSSGEREGLSMELHTDTLVQDSTMEMPSMPDIHVTVSALNKAEGVGTTLREVSILTASTDGDAPLGLDATFAKLAGTTATYSVDAVGRVGEMSTQGVADDPSLAAAAQSIQQSIAMLGIVFPEQPVGVGALWRVTHDGTMGGRPTTISTTYTLQSFDGRAGAVHSRVTVKAPEVELSPGMVLEPARGTGRGRLTFHTGSNLAEGVLEIDSQSGIRVPGGIHANTRTALRVSTERIALAMK